VRAKHALIAIGVVAGLAASGQRAAAQAPADAGKPSKQAKQAKPAAADNYDEQFARFLKDARSSAARPGDNWAWMSGLSLDNRARRVNDLVTIRVVESIAASGSADSALAKASDAKASVGGLFGLDKKLPSIVDPTNLAALKSDSTFKGSGTTNRSGDLTANLTARVSEVLPNGDLVVEGVREIEINGDRQIVVLSGVVRVADIAPSNTVVSTAIGQLRIRYFGRGLMKDNLKPGWLIRVLNKIF
jgi:flagellar L-ring protein precursor FlgH